jgi:hypothetical protein
LDEQFQRAISGLDAPPRQHAHRRAALPELFSLIDAASNETVAGD